MNNERALNILLEPHISEKSSQDNSGGEGAFYAFKVLKNATKTEIKQAVEQLFEVSVRSVRIVNIKSKLTRFGRTKGCHKAWKKTYVRLYPNQEIDLGSIE